MEAEHIYPGIERSIVEDGSIVNYTISGIGPGSLMPWRESTLKTLKSWPDDRPYLALHDLSSKGVSVSFLCLSGREIFNIGITQMGQTQVDKLLAERGNLKIRLALVVSGQHSGQVTARMHMSQSRPTHPQIQVRLFFKREAAMNWLREALPKTVSP